MRLQVRLHALVGLLIWLQPDLTSAWADEAACGFANLVSSAAEETETLGVCSVGAPHLLRTASLEICGAPAGRDSAEEAPKVAANALARARRLEAEGRYEEALLNLRVVEASLPRIGDHVALMRASLHESHGDHGRAAQAYADAVAQSPSIELRARARVARVRSLLRDGASSAEAELQALLARYPELPEAPSLRLALARQREDSGRQRSAVAIYRAIDLAYPGYAEGGVARERLAALAAEGHRSAQLSDAERLERAARLVRRGPVEQARATVMELRDRSFPRALVAQRDALVARFDELERRRFARTREEPAERPLDPAYESLKKRLSSRRGAHALQKLRSRELALYVELAASERARDVADQLVGELARRVRSASPELRFGALVVAIGTASDAELVKLADSLLATSTHAIPARYHRARALERMGRRREAERELREVVERDATASRFYASWAAQRLRELEGGAESACDGAGRAVSCNRSAIEQSLRGLEGLRTIDVVRATEALREVEQLHGGAYPWLARALDLVRLGEPERATDELYESYLAWRLSGRHGALRAGAEAIYRGAGIGRSTIDPATRRARRALDATSRMQLALAATALGDWGLAVNFGGLAFAEQHAVPYAAEVASAARKYGLDPDLLFAVMRVESVYQRRIISHAGAIGLMQIMPRTGRLIAEQLGHTGMTTTDLLDPRRNIEFSAWYLSSLIERMQGNLPLAIASYNGGPHNVRAWIRRFGTHIPLDAFLERIPFQETRRYVRRVLGYYGSYKAQRGQQIDRMALSLPTKDGPGAVAF